MVLGIIQARINSDRLPMKVFARFSDGSLVLERVIKQVSNSRCIDKIVVATNYVSFGAVSSFVSERFTGVSVVSGPDEDVLTRFIKCIDLFDDVETIVRVTADNPLTCPKYIDLAVLAHTDSGADLTRFVGLPLGTGAEVIKANALYRASELAFEQYDREHVTPYIYKNREIFRVKEIPFYLGDFQNCRVTLDTSEDFETISKVLEILGYKVPIVVEDVVEAYSLLASAQSFGYCQRDSVYSPQKQ